MTFSSANPSVLPSRLARSAWALLGCLALLLCSGLPAAAAVKANVTESFEKGLDGWTIFGPLWQVGVPTGGPGAAHTGANVAALSLSGSYSVGSSSTLSQFVSPAFVVPAAAKNPHLSFWQWYSYVYGFHNGSLEFETGEVQIRVSGTTTWTTLSGPYDGANSNVWSEGAVDLTPYAGQSVQIAFTYTPSGDVATGEGWFIDDVTLETGTATLNPNEVDDFEDGLGSWTMSGGLWQVGVPTGGPKAAHSGTSCAALSLAGSYAQDTSGNASLLVSPVFLVPAAGKNPHLSFWQWYSYVYGFHNGSLEFESGKVQIRVSGTTAWTTLSGPYEAANSTVWTEGAVDLSPYAGQSVQIAFTYTPSANSSTADGWFIDDVTLETGDATVTPNVVEGFEDGLGSWTMNGGLWQVGAPTGGPGAAHTGSFSAALNLAGSYAQDPSAGISQFVSPAFLVPAASQNPQLSFWQWYSFYYGYVNGTLRKETGTVQVRPLGGTTWTTIGGPYIQANGGWAKAAVDLTSYAGQTVQVAFTYTPTGNGATASGWYIDDLELVAPAEAQTISFAAIAGKTFGDKPFAVSATASSGLPVTFAVASGPATIAGSKVTITGAGTVRITASQAGNAYFKAATSVTKDFVVAKLSQTIGTFTPIATQYHLKTITITPPTASSGLPVTVTVTSGHAKISGNKLTLTAKGTVTLTASQAGDATHAAATPVSTSFIVQDGSQTITLGAIASQVFSTTPIAVTASASSGLKVALSVKSGPATIAGDTLTLTGVGRVVISANQAGNANYDAAPTASIGFNVTQAAQTITFAAFGPVVPGHVETLAAATTSGLPITYNVLAGPATISGSKVTFTGVGSVKLAADQPGNAEYKAAAQVRINVVVALKAQTIKAFATIPTQTAGGGPVTITVPAASSGLAVTVTVLSGSATLKGTTLTVTGGGTVVLAANQAGNGTYAAAPEVTTSFVVNKRIQSINFPPIGTVAVGQTETLVATASSGLKVTYSVTSGPATITGGKITFTAKGTVKLAADQAGNTQYNAAVEVRQNVTVK